MHRMTAADWRDRLARRLARVRPPERVRGASSSLDPDALYLGKSVSDGTPFGFLWKLLLRHVEAVGMPGSGKTTTLDGLGRQALLAGFGLLEASPHYDLIASRIAWLHRTGLAKERTVHLIDLRENAFITGTNLLRRPTSGTHSSIVADNFLALDEAATGENLDEMPLLRGGLRFLCSALVELDLTLGEAKLLIDPDDPHGIRAWAIDELPEGNAKDQLKRFHRKSQDGRLRRELDVLEQALDNRLNDFHSSETACAVVSQTTRGIDLVSAMDRGEIILVYAGDSERVSERAMRYVVVALLQQLYHALGKRKGKRPFLVNLDEAPKYLPVKLFPLLAAEARKYSVGIVAAYQYQKQHPEPTLAALRACTATKIIHGVATHSEAESFALDVIGLETRLEEPKASSIRPIVVGQRRTTFKSRSRSRQRAEGTSSAETIAASEMSGSGEVEGTSLVTASGASESASSGLVFTPEQGLLVSPEVLTQSAGNVTATSSSSASGATRSFTSFSASGMSHARSRGTHQARSEGDTDGESEGLESVFSDMPTAWWSLEEQKYKAARLLRSLETGCAIIAHRNLATLVKVQQPHSPPVSEEELTRMRREILERSPSALPAAEALAAIAARKQRLIDKAAQKDEPEDYGAPEPVRGRPQLRVVRDKPGEPER